MASFFVIALFTTPSLDCLPDLADLGGEACCPPAQPACGNPCGGASAASYAAPSAEFPRPPIGGGVYGAPSAPNMA